jgi:hypothetical protein
MKATMTRLDRFFGIIAVTIWAATMVFLISNGFWLLAFTLGFLGGYSLHRAWWAGRLAHAFLGLSVEMDRLLRDAQATSLDDWDRHQFYEGEARTMVIAYVLRSRAWWIGLWPFRGFRFRLPEIAPCPCGGPRIFVDTGVTRPAQFHYVCLECRFGARNEVEVELAAASRRIAERYPSTR